MKIYVASSWRNDSQPGGVKALRAAGHEVYDFRDPQDNGGTGFHWSAIDPDWQGWTPAEYVTALDHPVAQDGFAYDFNAMKWADVCVLIGPAGRSAHLELGWCAGAGKKTAILLDDGEPELMVKMCDRLFTSMPDLLAWLGPVCPTCQRHAS